MPPKSKTSPTSRSSPSAPRANVFLVFGDEDFLVETRARQIVDSLADKVAGEFGRETIDGQVGNAAEAVTVLRQVDEALNTLALFGGGKTVWLRNANFLGSDPRFTKTDAVKDQLEKLAAMLEHGLPPGHSLVISAPNADQRRTFFKTIQKIGHVVALEPVTDKWGNFKNTQLAEEFATDHARGLGKTLHADALRSLVLLTGGDFRALANEVDKLAAHVGERQQITEEDVKAIGSAAGTQQVWAMADALIAGDLRNAFHVLHRLLFQGHSVIGILFGLTGRIRELLQVCELLEKKILPPPSHSVSYSSVAARAAEKLGASLAAEARFNPLLLHPFRLSKIAEQAARCTTGDLRRMMELLLEANQRIVTTGIGDRVVLEQAMLGIGALRKRAAVAADAGR